MHDLLALLSGLDFSQVTTSGGGLLLGLAVKHLGRIARDINSLKTTVAVIATKTDSHGERIERIELAVFKGN